MRLRTCPKQNSFRPQEFDATQNRLARENRLMEKRSPVAIGWGAWMGIARWTEDCKLHEAKYELRLRYMNDYECSSGMFGQNDCWDKIDPYKNCGETGVWLTCGRRMKEMGKEAIRSTCATLRSILEADPIWLQRHAWRNWSTRRVSICQSVR